MDETSSSFQKKVTIDIFVILELASWNTVLGKCDLYGL